MNGPADLGSAVQTDGGAVLHCPSFTCGTDVRPQNVAGWLTAQYVEIRYAMPPNLKGFGSGSDKLP